MPRHEVRWVYIIYFKRVGKLFCFEGGAGIIGFDENLYCRVKLGLWVLTAEKCLLIKISAWKSYTGLANKSNYSVEIIEKVVLKLSSGDNVTVWNGSDSDPNLGKFLIYRIWIHTLVLKVIKWMTKPNIVGMFLPIWKLEKDKLGQCDILKILEQNRYLFKLNMYFICFYFIKQLEISVPDIDFFNLISRKVGMARYRKSAGC